MLNYLLWVCDGVISFFAAIIGFLSISRSCMAACHKLILITDQRQLSIYYLEHNVGHGENLEFMLHIFSSSHIGVVVRKNRKCLWGDGDERQSRSWTSPAEPWIPLPFSAPSQRSLPRRRANQIKDRNDENKSAEENISTVPTDTTYSRSKSCT